MNVAELIDKLKQLPPHATVVMCMDWTGYDGPGNKPNEQWEDDLGGVACAHERDAKWVYLVNRNFK